MSAALTFPIKLLDIILLLTPLLLLELPRIILGIKMPKRQPWNIPMACTQIGEESISVKSLMILPQNTPRNAPTVSE